MKVRIVKRNQLVPRPLEETFKFFSNPRIVETLTPSLMRFRLVGEVPATIQTGTILNYRFRVFRIPMNWRVCIETYEAPSRMVDVQVKGPFSHWVHEQTFIASGDSATEVRDRFEFGVPYGRVGELAYQLIIKSTIRHLFDYRANKMDMLMNRIVPRPQRPNMRAEHSRQPQS
jgi:ligand-binding SRPBCC domain-containing protein